MKVSVSQILNLLLAVSLLILIIKMNNKPTVNNEQTVEENQTLKIIHQRKSVRHYTEQKVSKEQLETLVKAGMAAPTAMNKQPWTFVVVKDRQNLDSLASYLPTKKMLTTASAAIVVCGDMNQALKGEGQPYWIQDCSAATQNILLAAESMGLGAVWLGIYPSEKNVNAVSECLDLPAHVTPLCVISIGYPVGDEKPKDKWKPEKLHWEKW